MKPNQLTRRHGLWLLPLIVLGCSSEPGGPKYSPRFVKLEDIVIDSPSHDGRPIDETQYQFGPHKVRFDDIKWRVYIDEQDYGPVKAGDVVKLEPEITVNGERREPVK